MSTHSISQPHRGAAYHNGVVRSWWLNLLLGMLLIACGAWMFLMPVRTYIALAIVFSISMFASGITEIIFSIANRKHYRGWGWSLTGGILDLVLGFVLTAYPVLPIVLLPVFLAMWLLFRGITGIITSFILRWYNEPAWWVLLLLGISAVMVSLYIFLVPSFGAISLVIMAAVAFVITGIYNIALAFRLRKFHLLA